MFIIKSLISYFFITLNMQILALLVCEFTFMAREFTSLVKRQFKILDDAIIFRQTFQLLIVLRTLKLLPNMDIPI